MKKERKDDSFIKQPYFKGGDKALNIFVNENLKYPEKSILNKTEGDVHIRFDINHKGDVIDAKIVGGLDDFCNEEALRVVKLLKYVVPKTPRNLKVTFHKNIRIHFHLQQKSHISEQELIQNLSDNQATQIEYTIVNLPLAMNEAQPPKPAITYTYVINRS